MKVKTNLSSRQLKKVGLGLQKLADKQQKNEIELENPAERKLVSRAEKLFDIALANLTEEMNKLFLDDKEG